MSTHTPTRTMKTTRPDRVPRAPEPRRDDFAVDGSDRSLGTNLPQRLGEVLWAPMLVMALMAFAAAMILGVLRADVVATTPDDAVRLAQLQHVTAGVMFIGFTAVLSGIAFAIARILGTFRVGGGQLQQATVGHVQTLRMPTSAKLMLALMMMGMMAIIGGVIAHFVVAAQTTTAGDLVTAEQAFVIIEAVRRIGVSLHLVAIAFGLATIIEVLRFQAARIGELATAPQHDAN
ncbi:MAG: hypothetical protein R6U94_06525 [Nitriliruptoraceae bacterium]